MIAHAFLLGKEASRVIVTALILVPLQERDIYHVLQNFPFIESWILVPPIKVPLRHFDVMTEGDYYQVSENFPFIENWI